MISPRQEKLLNIIIDYYIKTAEPVSSKYLVECGLFDLSSATLRGEMHELEEMGYLDHPYTSGGRVPTDTAYRFYVDNILDGDEFFINSSWQKKVDATLAGINSDPRDINRTVAQLLSELSENVVIAGVAEDDDFYKTGLASLFELPEFREINRVFNLTSFFEEFDKMFSQIEKEFFNVNLTQSSGDFNNINIFIGEENPRPTIRDETVMTARFNLPSNCVGSLVLIGPTRMDYKKNIGLVRYTTDRLNQMARRI